MARVAPPESRKNGREEIQSGGWWALAYQYRSPPHSATPVSLATYTYSWAVMSICICILGLGFRFDTKIVGEAGVYVGDALALASASLSLFPFASGASTSAAARAQWAFDACAARVHEHEREAVAGACGRRHAQDLLRTRIEDWKKAEGRPIPHYANSSPARMIYGGGCTRRSPQIARRLCCLRQNNRILSVGKILRGRVLRTFQAFASGDSVLAAVGGGRDTISAGWKANRH
ncbi:hypothetical protein C8R45DRAFT_1206686 [Mycena sanguinolenta]|nr:hypothetical protein C8R45DRAFT_1206686 [Mycena sanguinolenta]